jgi:LCP family protein required for cell wall assembly
MIIKGNAHARRRGAGRLIPIRRWPRRVLIAANLSVALMLVGTGLAYGYSQHLLNRIHTGSDAGLSTSDDNNVGASSGLSSNDTTTAKHSSSSTTSSESADGLSPENILLIGNETRAGQTMVNFGNASELTGTLSDVIMVLHLNPRKKTASIISIPRDVFVPMPAGSDVGTYEKIDAALNDGKLGPNNLAEAITQDFGIPINHYVEVDFDGFLQTVNALGGIKLDFPERLYDEYSGLNISKTGCQLIHGQQYDPPGVSASDTADWPYDPESDLARIVRDHTFIRVLASTAESDGIADPLKLNSFLNAVLDQLTIDPGLKNQLVSLVLHYHDINPFGAAATTIPVTQVTGENGDGYDFEGYQMGDVEFTDYPADLNTIEKWDPGAIPTPVKPSSVVVDNISGVDGYSATVGSGLQALGFNVSSEETGTDPGYESETLVQYHPGQLAEGVSVLEKLSGAVVLQSDASVPSGTVEVQAGSVLAVDQPATPTTTTTAGSTSSTTAGSTGSTTTTVPTPGGQTPSSATDDETPYDPRPC